MANASTGLGRICFITGSSTPKSIGRESTLLLAKHGARIVATDLPSMQGQGEELVQEIKKMGGEAIWVPLDVTKEEQWGPAIARWVIQRALGPNCLCETYEPRLNPQSGKGIRTTRRSLQVCSILSLSFALLSLFLFISISNFFILSIYSNSLIPSTALRHHSNAGIYAEAPFNDHISKHPTHLYDKTMEVNAKGVYFGIKYAAGSMIKRQVKESASIVNTSSIAGLAGNVGTFACGLSFERSGS